jgi:hypothetical protein
MAGKQYHRRRAAARRARNLQGSHLANKYAAMNAQAVTSSYGHTYYKAPRVRGLGWWLWGSDPEPVAAPTDADLFQAKAAQLRRKYAWGGPAWSKGGAFTSMLYNAQMSYDEGQSAEARRHFNNSLAILQEQGDQAIFEHGRELMKVFIDHTGIIDDLPISPAEKAAEKFAAIARTLEIEEAAEYAQKEEAIQSELDWSLEDEAQDQRLQEAMTDGSFGGTLAYAVGGDVGEGIDKTGKGIEKGLDPAEWLQIPAFRNLALAGALGLGAYLWSKR